MFLIFVLKHRLWVHGAVSTCIYKLNFEQQIKKNIQNFHTTVKIAVCQRNEVASSACSWSNTETPNPIAQKGDSS